LKVWYHTCQSRGKSCNNSKLTTENGCAIWYDEPEYWKEIQTRLNMTVPSLGPDYKLASTREVSYGQKKEGSEETQFIGNRTLLPVNNHQAIQRK
jgi:ATP-dependent RNA helicase DDX1